MAYIKYKELTKYFNFNKELSIEKLDKYVTDYINDDEQIYLAYKTSRDKGVFTDKRMILFDCVGILNFNYTKKIHIIPYQSISTSAILFKLNTASILLSLDSGYQMKLNFIHLKDEDKTKLRKLFVLINKYISDKNHK